MTHIFIQVMFMALKFLITVIYLVFVCTACLCHVVHVEFKEQLVDIGSFHHVSFRDWSEIISLGNKCLYLLTQPGTQCVAQTGLEFIASLLPQSPKCQEFKCKPPCWVQVPIFNT